MDAPKPTLTSEGLRAGRLEGVSFPELLVALCGTGSTGVLCVAHRGIKKNLYIDRGRVVFAASEDPDDRLGILLLQQNAITLHELETALKRRDAGRRIGTLLVEADSITPEQLTQAVIDQVKGIVLDLFALDDAEYRFTEGPLPTREVITIDLPTNALVLEGIKRMRSLNRIRQRIGGPTTVWGLSETWRDVLEGLRLSEGERLLVERLTQGEASLDDLCSEVFLSSFEICQLLWAFKVLGAIEELGFRADLPGEFPYRNAPKGHGFLEFLLELCRVKETGVLYARLGGRERSFHLREGECVFATSNDPEDGLVNFLLRRGVISLRDREETINRLLSNKRVGTILLELGVIDDADLRDMVRQQLIEVVYDTFRWVGGEFSFVSGPLPSTEPITLDRSLESLVVAGLRRVTSWSRIRKGCGGLRSILALTPEYLDVLDAMHAGVEEWEVVNAVRTPRSPLEVCQLSQLGNFRVCQILWAMKILGGIEVIQAERPEAWEEPAACFFSDPKETALGPVDAGDTVGHEAGTPPVATRETEVRDVDGESPRPAEETQAEELQAEEPRVEDLQAEELQAEELQAEEPRAEDLQAEELQAEEPRAEDLQAEDLQAEEPRAEDLQAEDLQAEEPRAEDLQAEDLQAEDLQAEDLQAEDLQAENLQVDDGYPEPEPGAGWTSDSGDLRASRFDPGTWPRGEGEAAGKAASATDAEESWEDRFQEGEEAVVDEARPEAVPSITDVEVSTRTVRMSRDEVESALRGNAPVADTVKHEPPDPEPGPLEADESTTASEPEIEIEIVAEPSETDEREAKCEEPPWDPPADLDTLIARFNALQRVIYRTVRSEVGAGAANFIRSCCEGGPQAEAIQGTELHNDGSWDAEGLRSAVIEKRIADPWYRYRSLIAREIETLRTHIGEARAHELRTQVERLEGGLNP